MTASILIWLGIAVVATGSLAGQALLTMLGMMLITIGAVSWLWAKHLLNSVKARVELETNRARYRDLVEGALVLVNDQPFPIPWLECRTEWPADLEAPGKNLSAHFKVGREHLVNVLSLRWFERVRRRFKVRCSQRGEFEFGPTGLVAADPFGFFDGRRDIDGHTSLVVYPRISPLKFRAPGPKSPFGDKRATSWIYDDPIRFRGAREYMPGDPFSRIEWKATARTGQLHTRVFDASVATEATLALNVSTKERAWEGVGRQQLERTLSVAASLLVYLHEKGFRIGLYTNGFVRGQGGSARVRMGSGQPHLRSCLELLGRLMPVPGARFPAILDSVVGQTGHRARLLLVTALLSPEIFRSCLRHRSRGTSSSVIFTGDRSSFNATPIPSIPVLRVHPEGGPEDLDEIIIGP